MPTESSPYLIVQPLSVLQSPDIRFLEIGIEPTDNDLAVPPLKRLLDDRRFLFREYVQFSPFHLLNQSLFFHLPSHLLLVLLCQPSQILLRLRNALPPTKG